MFLNKVNFFSSIGLIKGAKIAIFVRGGFKPVYERIFEYFPPNIDIRIRFVAIFKVLKLTANDVTSGINYLIVKPKA